MLPAIIRIANIGPVRLRMRINFSGGLCAYMVFVRICLGCEYVGAKYALWTYKTTNTQNALNIEYTYYVYLMAVQRALASRI